MPHRLFQHHHNIDTYGHNYYASSSNRSTGSPTVTSNGGTVAGSGSPGLQNQVPGLGLGPIHTYSTHTTTTPRNSGKKYSIRLSHICLVLGFLLGLYVLFFRAVFKTDASEGKLKKSFLPLSYESRLKVCLNHFTASYIMKVVLTSYFRNFSSNRRIGKSIPYSSYYCLRSLDQFEEQCTAWFYCDQYQCCFKAYNFREVIHS